MFYWLHAKKLLEEAQMQTIRGCWCHRARQFASKWWSGSEVASSLSCSSKMIKQGQKCEAGDASQTTTERDTEGSDLIGVQSKPGAVLSRLLFGFETEAV